MKLFKSIMMTISLAAIICLTACSGLDPNKTLWETLKDSDSNMGFGNREKEYTQSQNQSTLMMPADVKLASNNQLYPIPVVGSQPTILSASTLPPDSLAARDYLSEQDPGVLQAEQVEYVRTVLSTDNTGSLEVNSDFQSAWDMTGLAIAASSYKLARFDHTLGIYFVGDTSKTEDQGAKAIPLYQVLVQGGTRQSTISLVNEKGQALSPTASNRMLSALQSQLGALNNKEKPSVKAAALVNIDAYQHTDMLLNRTVSAAKPLLTQALQKAGFVLVKTDPKNSTIFFVDGRKTDGKVSSNMPLYLLYARNKGVYSSYYILDSQVQALKPALAADMLTALAQAVNQ
ncbi:MAG: NlpB/DapX lipoprotein [Gammaproteobacteria bacterium]|jgi:hypothetical protein|nr:NlpB/DapX lipoprotein [Gammaproteobacteria bacterium]